MILKKFLIQGGEAHKEVTLGLTFFYILQFQSFETLDLACVALRGSRGYLRETAQSRPKLQAGVLGLGQPLPPYKCCCFLSEQRTQKVGPRGSALGHLVLLNWSLASAEKIFQGTDTSVIPAKTA